MAMFAKLITGGWFAVMASQLMAEAETYSVAVDAGVPSYVNFHFHLEEDCTSTLPDVAFLAVPEKGRVWTVVDDYVVRPADMTYGGSSRCAGLTIKALYVAYEADPADAGTRVNIVYDRVLNAFDARWDVQVDIRQGAGS